MKLKQLHMRFFGPYADETVDFDDFRTSPLFLISGPTGSGKTTIFDALMYALYGETSGERDGVQMRSNFASHHNLTKVTLTFEHDGKLYSVTRQPQQLQQKKRGDGLTEIKAKVMLAIANADKQVAEYTKKNQVQAQLDEVLHLDAKQFRQIVLLPQGDFRRFLDADSNAKEDLLRDLFGTQLIQRWQAAMLAKTKKQGAKIQDQERLLNLLTSQFDFEVAPDENATPADKLDLMRENVEKQAATVAERQKTADSSHHAYRVAQASLQAGRQLAQAFKDRELTTAALAKLAEQEPTQRDRLKLMDQLTWVQQHEAAAQQVESTKQDLDAAKKQSAQTNAALVTTQQAMAQAKAKLSDLQQQAPAVEAKKKQLDQLQSVREQLVAMTTQKQQAAKQADAVAKAESALAQAQQKLADDQQALAQQQTELSGLSVADLANQAADQKQLMAMLTPIATNYQEAQADAAALEKKLAMVKTSLAEATKASETTAQQLTDLQQTQIKQQIARLAAKLKPGTPCPVCGSLEHPHPAVTTTEPLVTETAIKQAEQNRQQAAAKATTLQTQLKNLEEQQATADKKVNAAQQDFLEKLAEVPNLVNQDIERGNILQQLDALKIVTDKTVKALKTAKAKQTALEETLKATQAVVAQDEEKVQTAQGTFNAAKLEAAKATSALATMQAALPEGTSDLATVTAQSKELTQAVNDYQEQQQAAQDRVNELDRQLAGLHADARHATEQIAKLEKEHQKAATDFLAAVTEYFGENGSEQFAALQKQLPQLPDLQQQTQAYKDAVLQQKTLQDASNKTIGDQQEPALDQLEEQAKLTEEAATKAQTAFIEVKQTYDTAKKLLKQASDILAENQAALAAFADLQTLTTVMNGNGPKKLSLERYVLQAYLQQILDVANTRLQVLSNNRYQFVLHTDLGTQKIHSGLEIDVYDDQVGEQRAVQTLSGGESFIAALSLALALGEVIQQESGGINIDALFVDEGFGSLDTNSLDVAMNALESLEGESRLIGIISHVTELRDNIPDQLQVQPAGTGRSRLKVMHMA
ncbi:DNA repair protein [Lacticaseibacillus chiayiensis]|uniref:Nuclease SbcCD subunit C n=1 Tax=Lacticaseibacillus chiayiensis TaxID=2100821 RepID=A0A4Q1TUH8_9LACO|nr:SMC family ATPase [Lacticaseibacillus chiayiensis]QVI35272.1 SMC family ATPase [Lacticaseibacillus chiayiensis]RXT22476.1 DNA repair protein [Lacticaseibacillus chiayiensis]UYN57053.1 SMC family ATPase [Lacticaseibacillus chiayiensis]